MKFSELLESMIEADEEEVDSEDSDSDQERDSEEGMEIEDEEFKDRAIEIMASAIAAGMSEIDEQLGLNGKVESIDDAVKFVTTIITALRVSKRDVLRKSLRKYERLGHDRFRRDYRKQLSREYDKETK
jgi:hypothetical protein